MNKKEILNKKIEILSKMQEFDDEEKITFLKMQQKKYSEVEDEVYKKLKDAIPVERDFKKDSKHL